jgi:hypothetical protein
MSEERFHFVVSEVETGHSFIEATGAHESGDVLVGMGGHEAEEVGSAVGAGAVTTVADAAAVGEGADGRGGLLRLGRAYDEKYRATKFPEHRFPSFLPLLSALNGR